MAKSIHVSGEALLRTGTASLNALEDLGVSVDGVDIEIRDYVSPVHVDTYGGPSGPPFDEIGYGQTATISAQLVFYDKAVLAKIRPPFVGGTDGQQGTAGTLYGAGSKYFRLLITSTVDTDPFNFVTVRCLDAKRAKVGVRQTIWSVTFFATPYSGASGSTSTNTLYNTTTT